MPLGDILKNKLICIKLSISNSFENLSMYYIPSNNVTITPTFLIVNFLCIRLYMLIFWMNDGIRLSQQKATEAKHKERINIMTVQFIIK